MSKLKKTLYNVVLFFASFISTQAEDLSSLKLESPDGKLVFNFTIEDAGEEKACMFYNVVYLNKPVVMKSRLGINSSFKERYVDTWNNNIKVIQTSRINHNEIWEPVYGERDEIKNIYNQLSINVESGNKFAKGILQIIIRAYNEGIAFRYYFFRGHNGGGHLHIASELTEFVMPENTKVYYSEYAQSDYRLLPLSGWPSEAERPLTLELQNGLVTCLTEAEVINYARTKFVLDSTKLNTIKCSMYDTVDLIAPYHTPWRVIMVAETPRKLLENNDMILNLNPPSELENTSWIKPGKVMRDFTLSTDGAMKCIDFATEQNLQYLLFDAGWYGDQSDINADATTVTVDPDKNPKGDLDLPKVIKYAKSKNIGIILYVNVRALAYQLEKMLPVYKSWGIAGLKFGFVQVGSHYWTNWLHETVKKCAEYELMVNIHDEYRPTGFSRTYPNLMTQEGIRGNEEMPSATTNTILPFTRFIAGAADYTFCYYYREEFGHPNRHIQATPAHQLALPVVYYSPWQFMYWYDSPDDYKGEPELEFWKDVPTVWDDTKVINGEIGKYITVARQSGSEWFVGTITNVEAREIKIPLSFLEKGKKYEAIIYSDDPSVDTRTHVGIEHVEATNATILTARLKASGGAAIHIRMLN
ncbi:MAG: glycoside hydrolase family 97 catalytic domain-containing protein [Ignavibacteria bacterium]|jgi:alpha-glucosidase